MENMNGIPEEIAPYLLREDAVVHEMERQLGGRAQGTEDEIALSGHEKDIELEDEGIEGSRVLIAPDNPEREEDDWWLPLVGEPAPLISRKGCIVDALPEYPRTHPDGYTYLVNVESLGAEQIEEMLKGVQYSTKQTQKLKPTFSPALGCSVGRATRVTTGARICEFLHPDLMTMRHECMSDSMWNVLRDFRSQEEDNSCSYNATISHYRAAKRRFANGTACNKGESNCRLIKRIPKNPDVLGNKTPYLCCVNARGKREEQSWHFYCSLNASIINFELLDDLLSGKTALPPISTQCARIENTSSRSGYCGIAHPQGQGQMKTFTDNSVKITICIPRNFDECKYIAYCSHGEYKIAPPPPSKAPAKLVAELIETMRRAIRPDITLGRFLGSPELKAFCQTYRSSSVFEMHTAFANKDKISRMLYAERLRLFPQGPKLGGVIFEYEQRHKEGNPDERYIQDVFFDQHGVMIILALKALMKVMLQLESFEVDMSFKRIRDTNFNEIIFAVWIPKQGKIMTLARVITNQNRRTTYKLAFQRLFNAIERETGDKVQWHHIHGSGFRAVVMDMCGKQLAGLGYYLHQIDPEHRPWFYHCENIAIFCRIHLRRSIDRATGGISGSDTVCGRMIAILAAESSSEYFGILEWIIANEPSAPVQRWAKHKKHPLIASGLNASVSRIENAIFQVIRANTNAAEQSANQSYSYGKGEWLLPAIQNAHELDKRHALQYLANTEWGVRHTYRSTALEDRLHTHMAREKRKNARLALVTTEEDFEGEDPIDEDDRILFEASSSGNVSGIARREQSSSKRPAIVSRAPSRGSSPAGIAKPASRKRSLPTLQTTRQREQSSLSLNPILRRALSGVELDGSRQLSILQAEQEKEDLRALKLQNEQREIEIAERRLKLEQARRDIEEGEKNKAGGWGLGRFLGW